MAIDTRHTPEELAATADYIRRLCEGESVEHPSDTCEDESNSSQGQRPAIRSSEAECMSDPGSAAKPMSNRLRTPPKQIAAVASKTEPTTPKSAVTPAMNTPSRSSSKQCTNGTPTSAAGPSSRPKRRADGTASGGQSDKAHDVCDACGQPGQFICCDSCPRVFHFLCAEPPLAYESVVTIDHWYCRECAHLAARKRKSRAHAKNIFYPLISDMESRNPKAFAVPDDIRRQFDGIEADIDGTFINTREDRPQRANAGPANRDFARLVNDHNEAILCYRCGLSALHGLIVRCDYCPLSWHWDCLDPPLSAAPPPRKKWMCPNHADHAMRRHHKFRKERIVDLTDAPANTRNSGAVEIIDDDPPPSQELFDPKVKYRVPSSHIRQAFADRASASRPALENRHGTISDSSGSSLAAPATSTSLAADHIPQGDGDPSPTSIAEWLQSLVMFQQDVARFVMRTAKQAALQAAAGSREMDSEDEDTVYASGKSQNSQDEKLAFLSTIAARILDPTASESSTLTKTASHNEAASSSLSETIPGTSSDEDQSLERAQLRRLRILAQHGIADSDFQEAAKLFVSRSSLQCRCCALDCHTNGGASNAICAKDSDNSSNKRKPKLCAQAPDSRLDGPQLKRIRSSLKSPSDGAQEQYGHSTAQAPKAAVLEEEPTGEAAVAGTPTADDSGSNTTASSIQASQAVDLIFALLSKKGPDALVDFLLSD